MSIRLEDNINIVAATMKEITSFSVSRDFQRITGFSDPITLIKGYFRPLSLK